MVYSVPLPAWLSVWMLFFYVTLPRSANALVEYFGRPASATAPSFSRRHAVPSSTMQSSRTRLGVSMTSTLPHPSWNSNGTDAHSLTLDYVYSSSTTTTPHTKFRVFCDLDGVLVDFAQGVTAAFGVPMQSHNIDALPRGLLWETVQTKPAFFEHLPWCADGQVLWEALRPLQPDILTGVPSYCQSPRNEKFAWCQRELAGPISFQHTDKAGRFRTHRSVSDKAVPAAADNDDGWHCRVITCWSECKHHESGPGAVLIDDRIDLKRAWEAAGGIFIHHSNVQDTFRQLRRHGILDVWGAHVPHP